MIDDECGSIQHLNPIDNDNIYSKKRQEIKKNNIQ